MANIPTVPHDWLERRGSEPKLTTYQWSYIQGVIGAIASEHPEDLMAQSIRDELFKTIGVR